MTENDKNLTLSSFTDIFADEIANSQPLSLSPLVASQPKPVNNCTNIASIKSRPPKHTGQYGDFRSVDEIEEKYRGVFTYPFFNLVQSNVIEDALYSDKSMVICAPTGSGKTVVFEMAIVQLLMELEDKKYTDDFKIIYMAPVKAICTERLTEWYPKFTKLGLLCIEVTGDTDVDFSQLKPYRIIITTPEKWDVLTRRWTEYRGLAAVIKLFLIDEVHILNDEARGPVLEAVVSRMKTIESSSQSAFRIEQLQQQYRGSPADPGAAPPRIRFVAVSATVSNPEDVAAWLANGDKPVYHKFGDECRPVKIKRVVEGYPCGEGMSIFKFDIILNYKLWPIIQKYYDGKPTLIFCNTRKSVALTAETLAKELTINFNPEQKAKLTALASTIKTKKLQALVLSGVGCHHAGLLYEERVNIEHAFRRRDLPILITTTTLAMGVNLPAHLVIIKNTQQYVNGTYQEYSISTVLQMVGRAGRPQFDTEATAVIMTRLPDKPRYQALVGGSEPLQSYLHKRLPENLNSEAALQTVTDVAQCVQWLRSTFLYIRAAKEPRRYLGLPPAAAPHLISKKIEELCVKAMNGLATSGLITMDEASCIQSTEAGKLMSVYYLDFETMKRIMMIEGTETLEQLLCIVCECHELADLHLRVDERRCLNALNRNNSATTIRFPMKGKISTRQMKLSCLIQAVLGCLPIPDPSLNQESMKIMRIAERVSKCLRTYATRLELVKSQPQHYAAVLNAILLCKCVSAHLWENSPFVSKQLRGIGPTISNLLVTAGKVNFMLLEEAHPRDLERIMNKGPPAGNVLRKQVSLLPKYKLTTTPVDERTVIVELSLLNQSFLAENIPDLTAGDRHTSYVLVGDSENHILMLASFKDKDLLTVFDGTLTYTVTRKHRFEHKVFVHCISSTFVGIDVQTDYFFKDLDPMLSEINSINSVRHEETPSRLVKKQTNITDTFKERKRRNDQIDICQSKEKRKRNNALVENFKTLKDSFGKNSKQLQDDLIKSKGISNAILSELDPKEPQPSIAVGDVTACQFNDEFECDFLPHGYPVSERKTAERDHLDDSRFDNILNDLEKEISETIQGPRTGSSHFDNDDVMVQRADCVKINLKANIKSQLPKMQKKADNFKFVDLLEKNVDFSDDEVEKPKHTGFSEAIKSHVQQYLQKAKITTTNQTDLLVPKELLEFSEPIKTNREILNKKTIQVITEKNYDILEKLIENKFDDLPESLQQEDFADKLTQNIFDNQAPSNKNTHVDINEIEHDRMDESIGESQACAHHNMQNNNGICIEDIIKIHDEIIESNIDNIIEVYDEPETGGIVSIPHEEDLPDHPTQNMSDDQELADRISPTGVINIEREIYNESKEKNQSCGRKNNINMEDIHEIHNEIKKSRIKIHDKPHDENVSQVRALFKNISTDVLQQEKIFDRQPKKTIFGSDITMPVSVENGVVDTRGNNNAYLSENDTNLLDCVTEDNNLVPINYRVPSAIANITTFPIKKIGNTSQDFEVTENIIIATYNDAAVGGSSSLVQSSQARIDRLLSDAKSQVYLTNPKHGEFNELEPNIKSNKHLLFYDSGTKLSKGKNNPPYQRIDAEIKDLYSNRQDLNFKLSSTETHHSPTNDSKVLIDRQALRCRSPPVDNNSPPNIDTQNRHFMNKYTYTTTQIDIWTKQHNNKLQVIKQLKVDVDYTEIVTEDDNNKGNYVIGSEQSCIQNTMMQQLNKSDKGSMQNAEEQKLLLRPNNNSTTQESSRAGTKYIDTNTNLTPKESIQTFIPNAMTHQLNSNIYSSSKSEETTTQDAVERNVLPTRNNNYTNQGISTAKKTFIESNNNLVPKDSSLLVNEKLDDDFGRSAVENIIQKYYKVFRKNDQSPPIVNSPTVTSSQTKPESNRTKRPFNISDIHRVEASLPDSIIVDIISPAAPPSYSTAHAKNTTSLSEYADTYNEQPNVIVSETTAGHVVEMKPIIKNLSPPQQLETIPMEGSLDVSELPEVDCADSNYNIDCSMLNPQMVLQCYKNKPEVEAPMIPPPTQFCDNQVYSPSQDMKDFRNSYFETNDTYDYDSKYVENSALDMSEGFEERKIHSNEIETWSFDEDLGNYGLAEANANSVLISKDTTPTFLHTQSLKSCDRKGIGLRKARLGEFKFLSKQKLNVRRK